MQEKYHGNKFRNTENTNSDSLMLTAFLAKAEYFSLLRIEVLTVTHMQLK